MKKNTIRKAITAFLIVVTVLLTGCTTTRHAKINTKQILNGEDYLIYDESVLLDEEDADLKNLNNYRYIFIRLYNPVYKDMISAAGILQAGMYFVEINDAYASHAAVNLNLKDSFYGLTAYARPQFSPEYCVETYKNRYTKKCNKKESLQTVLALKVSIEEYKDFCDLFGTFITYNLAEYDAPKNFQMAGYTIGRRVTYGMKPKKTKAEKRNHPAKKTIDGTERVEINLNKKYRFVCSTIISYFLYNSVNSYKNYLDQYNLSWNNISPSDFVSIPGFEVLFTSKWKDYNRASREFVKKRPEFEIYR